MALPTPVYLNPPPKYLLLFEIEGAGGPPLTITPDTESTDPANIPATRQFNPAGARCVEVYWDGDELPVGVTASLTFLRYDGIANKYIYVGRFSDVPPDTAVIVPTCLASRMAVLLTAMSDNEADAVRVHIAQAFEVYA